MKTVTLNSLALRIILLLVAPLAYAQTDAIPRTERGEKLAFWYSYALPTGVRAPVAPSGSGAVRGAPWPSPPASRSYERQ